MACGHVSKLVSVSYPIPHAVGNVDTLIKAFNPEKNPLNVPIVQVSLFDSEDPEQHHNLGRALSALRSENILIICSGMAVHNLRNMRLGFMNSEPLSYA